MNELQVTYLKNGHYQRNKILIYDTFEEALKIFESTVKKFKKIEQQALITIRVKQNNQWFLSKIERV